MSTPLRTQVFIGSAIAVAISIAVAVFLIAGAEPPPFGRGALIALGVGVATAALVAGVFSRRLARRVRAIAAIADRYSSGDLTRPAYDYGSDEIGAVARVLDASVQELAARLEELSRDRARMEAILSGMVEGVLVLDRNGRVQLVNGAAHRRAPGR